MKIYTWIFIIIIITSCNTKNAELHQLQIENDSLRIKIAELDSLKVKNAAQVTIANTEVQYITSKYNKQQYQIKISYPKSYFINKEKKYPVLYVLDAETNFGGVSYIVQRLIKDELIPEILVVGIAYDTDYKNFYKLRSRDLTPVEDKNLRMGNHGIDPTGGAPIFSDFIEFELFPLIEKNYRIEKEDRAIYGHSYGGLYGSYVLTEKSHLFNRYLILGPSLWYKSRLLVNELPSKDLTFDKRIRLYMGSGEFDKGISRFQTEFAEILEQKEITNLSIKAEVIENETHRTIFGVGFTNGLRFIYEQ